MEGSGLRSDLYLRPEVSFKIRQSQFLSVFADKKAMKNQNSLFVVFCLSLALGVMGVYSLFVGYFNDHAQYEARLSRLQEQVKKEQFNSTLLGYQLKDFQQTVAQVLPDEKKIQARYELRNLAAAVRTPASDESVDLSGVLYEKGKKYFSDRNYDKAIQEFDRLLNKYPLSLHRVEAHFFIAESYFLKNDFRGSLSQIDQMVTHFPQHDLTGFILLRMGQISEFNNQNEEASEIYKAVANNFKNEDLKKQAAKLTQGVEYR